MDEKMKVEIWSDIVCPFCYIGKRLFEKALAAANMTNDVDIEWKSFQLAPDMKTDPGKSAAGYLSEAKGISLDDAHSMNRHITERAKEVGLEFNYDRAITANTMKAHSLAHFAKQHGKQHEAEELLFRSYFTDGKNIDDTDTLLELGRQLQLDTEKLRSVLEEETLVDTVREDIYEAKQLGVRGVPFFVFNRKYAVSGAQPEEVFVETLKKSMEEFHQEKPLATREGDSCDADGTCY